MEQALIKTDKETLSKVKKLAAEKGLSVSAFIRDIVGNEPLPVNEVGEKFTNIISAITDLKERTDQLRDWYNELQDDLKKVFDRIENSLNSQTERIDYLYRLELHRQGLTWEEIDNIENEKVEDIQGFINDVLNRQRGKNEQ